MQQCRLKVGPKCMRKSSLLTFFRFGLAPSHGVYLTTVQHHFHLARIKRDELRLISLSCCRLTWHTLHFQAFCQALIDHAAGKHALRNARTMSSRPASNAPHIPPPPQSTRRRKSRREGYDLPRDRSPRRKHEIHLELCLYHSTRHSWKTEPLRFNPDRINDRELWTDIRDIFRQDIQKPWLRIFGFKKVTSIVPIAVSLKYLQPRLTRLKGCVLP